MICLKSVVFVQIMFDGECLCDGPVETWLNGVVAAMKQALFAEYQKAIPAYDTMKRSSEWIYEFSAQNTIVVSRTFFTQEVNEAFDELEEGNEDALKVRIFVFTSLEPAGVACLVHWHAGADQSNDRSGP